MTNNQKIAKYIRQIIYAKSHLKKLGVIRSDKSIIGDYAEWLAAKYFHLKLANTGVNKTVDAKDSKGYTYQIKARTVTKLKDSTSFDFNNYEPFNYLIIVFLNKDSLETIIDPVKIPWSYVQTNLSNNKKNKRFRWNKKVREDLKLVFT